MSNCGARFENRGSDILLKLGEILLELSSSLFSRIWAAIRKFAQGPIILGCNAPPLPPSATHTNTHTHTHTHSHKLTCRKDAGGAYECVNMYTWGLHGGRLVSTSYSVGIKKLYSKGECVGTVPRRFFFGTISTQLFSVRICVGQICMGRWYRSISVRAKYGYLI